MGNVTRLTSKQVETVFNCSRGKAKKIMKESGESELKVIGGLATLTVPIDYLIKVCQDELEEINDRLNELEGLKDLDEQA